MLIKNGEPKIVCFPDSSEKESFEIGENADATIVIGNQPRLTVEAVMTGRGGSLQIVGGFRGAGEEKQELILRVVQDAPDTSCRVRFRAALTDSAVSLFDGLITMTERAAGSSGHLSYKALLLSKNAKAKPIPRLEILTKSVASAGHEASVGKIDEQQLFYLQSRGLSREEAQRLIVEGFLK